MRNTDWKILMVLYEKRSITKTAETLYMTQSAVTKRLQSIESEWGVRVVNRNSQGVVFTDEGRYLVERASIMLDLLKEIEDRFAACRLKKEHLTIGVPNSFAKLYMPGLLKEYMLRFNELDIQAVSDSSDVLIRKLTDGTLDLGFICGDFPYLGEKIALFDEDLYLLAPRDLTLEQAGKLPLIKAFLNPLVQLLTDQWWKKQFGNLPHETYKVPFTDIAIEMVENSLGITFLFGDQWDIDESKVQRIPLYDDLGQPVTRRVWLMLSDRCFRSQAIMDFVALAEDLYRKEL